MDYKRSFNRFELKYVMPFEDASAFVAKIAQHLDAGARKVLLTVPAKDEIDATIVLGVNDEELKAEHQTKIDDLSQANNDLNNLILNLMKLKGVDSVHRVDVNT